MPSPVGAAAPGTSLPPAKPQSFFFRELSFPVGEPRPDLPAKQPTDL